MRNLRRILIKFRHGEAKGFFHRFVYMQNEFETVTKALIEHDNGDLELININEVRFIDKTKN
jgi:hypothetical protein